jgi:hypothetical protein
LKNYNFCQNGFASSVHGDKIKAVKKQTHPELAVWD